MRLWTLHPKYLDPQGLTGLWREALLARKVLRGETDGYTEHPQLVRFREYTDPVSAADFYLDGIFFEATEGRCYDFDGSKIEHLGGAGHKDIEVTFGQVQYEREHLLEKLEERDEGFYHQLLSDPIPDVHPLFEIVQGGVADWEDDDS